MIYVNKPLMIELSEEGSLSEESYSISFRALVEALENCVNVNNSNINIAESSSNVHGVREEEENQGSLRAKTSKKKSTYKKRKVSSEVVFMYILSLSLYVFKD
jgi:hypothetical protein